MNSSESETAPKADLQPYLAALWRRRWLILLLVVLLPAVVYAVATRAPKQYDATAIVQITVPQSEALDGVTVSQATGVAWRLIYTDIVKNTARRYMKTGTYAPIIVTPDLADGFLTLDATGPNALQDASTVDSYANAIVDVVRSQAAATLGTQLASLRAQLATIPLNDVVARQQLEQQIAQTNGNTNVNSAGQLVQGTGTPTRPVSPRPVRAALVSVVIALLLALLATALAEALDKKFRDPESIEKETGLTLLTTVPALAFKGHRHDHVSESFARLRAGLANVDGTQHSVLLVASPGPAEGKTLTAINLALAYARAGQHVVLLEADLRLPTIAARLQLPAGPGLTEALLDHCTALVDVPTDDSVGSLRAVICRGPQRDPSELIASDAMHRLIDVLRAEADVVIIDTSPLLAVPDALPLLRLADGIVLVARVNVTRSDRMRRAMQIAEYAHARVLGVVATGAVGGDPYRYYAYPKPKATRAARRSTLPPIPAPVPQPEPAAEPEPEPDAIAEPEAPAPVFENGNGAPDGVIWERRSVPPPVTEGSRPL
jgi:capsular exopolysaccharide synthesis family protein